MGFLMFVFHLFCVLFLLYILRLLLFFKEMSKLEKVLGFLAFFALYFTVCLLETHLLQRDFCLLCSFSGRIVLIRAMSCSKVTHAFLSHIFSGTTFTSLARSAQ